MAESPSAPEEVNEKKQRRQERRQMKRFWCCREPGAVFLYTDLICNLWGTHNSFRKIEILSYVIKGNSILILLEVFFYVCFCSAIFSNQIIKWNPPYFNIGMPQISLVCYKFQRTGCIESRPHFSCFFFFCLFFQISMPEYVACWIKLFLQVAERDLLFCNSHRFRESITFVP